MFFYLLIVPYGIETYSEEEGEGAGDLLIVPYGIETSVVLTRKVLSKLLIVPYGIETTFHDRKSSSGQTFNRTLWN